MTHQACSCCGVDWVSVGPPVELCPICDSSSVTTITEERETISPETIAAIRAAYDAATPQTLLDAHTEILSPSERCRKYHLQMCCACDRADCGDNTTPSIEQLCTGLAKRDAVIARLVEAGREMIEMGHADNAQDDGITLKSTVTRMLGMKKMQAALNAAKEISND